MLRKSFQRLQRRTASGDKQSGNKGTFSGSGVVMMYCDTCQKSAETKAAVVASISTVVNKVMWIAPKFGIGWLFESEKGDAFIFFVVRFDVVSFGSLWLLLSSSVVTTNFFSDELYYQDVSHSTQSTMYTTWPENHHQEGTFCLQTPYCIREIITILAIQTNSEVHPNLLGMEPNPVYHSYSWFERQR